ncbi:hydroxyacid dehydrogenase [Streptomyces sp. NPDC058735]|uniref:hydroxyacid dehydrogenase n=1 Tax=unclassified Streptomyces TaxID=2593676 RepID=UPI003688551A
MPEPSRGHGHTTRRRPRVVTAMAPATAAALLNDTTRRRLTEACDLYPMPPLDDFTTPEAAEALATAEVLLTGWGCPPVDEDALRAAPRLRAIVHTAGSIRGLVTDACWERGIAVSSAASANALPVAEYTVAMILLSGKRVLERAHHYRRTRTADDWLSLPGHLGNHQRTIGILSASLVGRRVIELLRPYDLPILLHDPHVDAAEAAALGTRPVTLPELFTESDLVSVHTPLLPETRGLVTRELIDSMRPDAVLLNTARGAIVDQHALTDAVTAGRVRAVLDVTEPEVLPADHPLWTCDNALITPHLAGSQGNEWHRLTTLATEEIVRWAAGATFTHPVLAGRAAFLA